MLLQAVRRAGRGACGDMFSPRKWLSKETPAMSFLPDMSAYWTRPVMCWFQADDYIVILCGVLVVGVLFAGECKVRGHNSRNVNEWTVAFRDTVTASPPPSPGSLSLCLSSFTCDIPPKPQLLSGLASNTRLHGTNSRDCPKIRLVHPNRVLGWCTTQLAGSQYRICWVNVGTSRYWLNAMAFVISAKREQRDANHASAHTHYRANTQH